MRSSVTGCGLAARLAPDDVPAVVYELVRSPPAVQTWVPEVHFVLAMLASEELCFQGREDAFTAWMLKYNRQLLSGVLYRVLFAVVSPDRVLRGGGKRWGAFHQGSFLDVLSLEETRAELELSYPEHLFPLALVKAFGTAFEAAGEAAGGSSIVVHSTVMGSGKARYDIRWR